MRRLGQSSSESSRNASDENLRKFQSSSECSRNNSHENLRKYQCVHVNIDKLIGGKRIYPKRPPIPLPMEVQASSESDRASPPLYEVELTASDEDDDASVLELVIPMQSRYQRVPTSSPKKSKPKKVKRYLCSLICCGRARK